VDPADEALSEAWTLADENYTAELYARFEELLPMLIQAGYADADEHTWHFTPKGVARANELADDAER
jgi:hypothetical protein